MPTGVIKVWSKAILLAIALRLQGITIQVISLISLLNIKMAFPVTLPHLLGQAVKTFASRKLNQ